MRRIAYIGALAISMAGAFAGAAFAQDPGNQGGGVPGMSTLDFVISAGRTAEEADSVPAQVTVITALDIAESGASSLVQVLERAPGVSFMPAMAGTGTESISMRGFGENSFGRVLVLVDGVRLNNPDMKALNWNSVALADIERIEVLDGGASVLYGNNAVAGVINIITKKGSAGTRTAISGSVGSFQTNAQRFSHQASSKLGEFSITAEHLGSVGYRDRQASQSVNASARATLNLTDALSVSAQGSIADLGYQLPGSLSKVQFEADPTQAMYYDYDLSAYMPNYNDEGTEHHYAGVIGLEWLPNDDFQMELPLSYGYKDIHADIASWVTYTDRVVQTAEARPKLTAAFSAGGMPVRLVGGVDLYGAWLDVHSYSDEPRTTESNQFAVTELGAGPYLSARADILPNLSATGGIRYDTARITAVNKDKSVDDEIVHAALIYDGGLSFRPHDGLKLYAKFGTLFRYPFTDEQAETSGYASDQFNAGLKPETGFNAEAGFAIDLAKRLSFSGNFYYMQLRDEIALNASYHNENLDRTRRIGSSVGLTARPSDFLKLDASYSFVEAVFAAGANEGKYIPLVPVHGASASVTLILPAGLSLGPTVTYKSDAWQGGDNANSQEKVDAYLVYGAKARWELERSERKVAVQATVGNLLGTAYAPMIFYGGYYPAEGRTVSVSVEYRY